MSPKFISKHRPIIQASLCHGGVRYGSLVSLVCVIEEVNGQCWRMDCGSTTRISLGWRSAREPRNTWATCTVTLGRDGRGAGEDR